MPQRNIVATSDAQQRRLDSLKIKYDLIKVLIALALVGALAGGLYWYLKVRKANSPSSSA